jgi:hypothetical protein
MCGWGNVMYLSQAEPFWQTQPESSRKTRYQVLPRRLRLNPNQKILQPGKFSVIICAMVAQ